MTQPIHSMMAKAQLSTSPRLLQAVRLLQMSSLEFEQELQQQLAQNPFLEACDNEQAQSLDGMSEDDEPHAESESSPTDTALFDRDEHSTTLDARDDSAEVSSLHADDGGDELPEAGFEATRSANADRDDSREPFESLSEGLGLRERLHEQARGAQLDDRERLAVTLLIESLEDDGYLRSDPAETSAPLDLARPPTAQEWQAGLDILQQFDPIGVGARSLSECLALQLGALPVTTPGVKLALRIVGEHLALLAAHDSTRLLRRLDCSLPSLRRAESVIRQLDPRPGLRYAAARTDYLVPDVIVRLVKGRLVTAINPAVLPRARLDQGCVALLRRAGADRHPAMQRQLQEARWLLRSAAQRHITILRVAEAVVARQRAFFHYGEIALKPLILREVADELALHESTLSRATSNKTMATPRGSFEFRHFFSRQLGTDTGGTCSAAAVRALIREMIDGESRSAPLSDVTLAHQLGGHGISVARRTVTKYRNQMKLPAGDLRHRP